MEHIIVPVCEAELQYKPVFTISSNSRNNLQHRLRNGGNSLLRDFMITGIIYANRRRIYACAKRLLAPPLYDKYKVFEFVITEYVSC